MNNEQRLGDERHWSSVASICFGIVSIFLWEFSIIPILAIVFGVIGLVRDEKKWKAGIGIVLGIIFIAVRINHGYIDRGFPNPPVGTGISTAPLPTPTSTLSPASPSLTKSEIYEKGCDSLPTTSFIRGLASTATIDENSLIVRMVGSETPQIYGTFTNANGGNAGGLVVVIWEGRLSLNSVLSDALSEHKSIVSASEDHSGPLWSCPMSSASGRFGTNIWKSFWESLPVGEYTVGVYAGSYPIYNPGFNGDYTPAKLLATGILKVMPK
jgi:hypothetical protein